MIELEILISPDQEVIGKHQFFLPKIEVGKSHQCQLPIRDPQCSSSSLYLESTKDNLFIRNTQLASYHFNEKKISGKKLVRPGDQIKIGQTIIILINYNPATIVKPFKLDISQDPFESSSEGEMLLESIENELLFIEYNGKE